MRNFYTSGRKDVNLKPTLSSGRGQLRGGHQARHSTQKSGSTKYGPNMSLGSVDPKRR